VTHLGDATPNSLRDGFFPFSKSYRVIYPAFSITTPSSANTTAAGIQRLPDDINDRTKGVGGVGEPTFGTASSTESHSFYLNLISSCF
jgi:hypothetical protein